MSTTQTTTLQASLELIAKKSGKTLAEVQTAYGVALKSLPASIKAEVRKQQTALLIVNRDLAVNTRSTAVVYEGVIVGAKRVRDLMEGVRTRALEAYNKDPQKALDEQLVKLSDDGQTVIVLDNRTESNGQPNKKLGQPRPEHMFMRECFIAARKPGETDFSVGKISLWNQQAKLTIPILKNVEFKANGGIEDGKLNLRSGVDTIFEIKSENNDDVMNIIDNSFTSEEYKTLAELFDYHKSIQASPERFDKFIVTEGTVDWINISDDNTKNHSITLNSNELPEGSRGIKVWIPNELGNLLTFGRGSIVSVIGYTSMGKGWNSELKQQTNEEVVQINAYGIIGRPGLTTQGIDQGEVF